MGVGEERSPSHMRRCIQEMYEGTIMYKKESTYKFLVNFSSRMDFDPCLSPV